MQLILDIFAMRLEAMKETSGSPSSTKIHVAPFSWSGIMLSRQAGALVAVDLVKVSWNSIVVLSVTRLRILNAN
ncbi:MAG: hypothetical protein ACLS3V_03400 [Streptococcus sp.]